MRKVFWLDVETTGVDSSNCAIIQLAALTEINREIVDTISFNIQPHEDAQIDEKALEVNGKTIEQLKEYPNHKDVFRLLSARLSKTVNKFDRSDKMILAGYNIGFDDQFLRALFTRCNDRYYGSYFVWPKLDVQTFVASKIAEGLILPNYKLSTVCAYFGINLVAHDALSDILATRDLYYKLGGTYVV